MRVIDLPKGDLVKNSFGSLSASVQMCVASHSGRSSLDNAIEMDPIVMVVLWYVSAGEAPEAVPGLVRCVFL